MKRMAFIALSSAVAQTVAGAALAANETAPVPQPMVQTGNPAGKADKPAEPVLQEHPLESGQRDNNADDVRKSVVGVTGTRQRSHYRVQVDLGPNLLYRLAARNRPTTFFDGNPTVSGLLRGGLWLSAQSSNEVRPIRFGLWWGYRYEPGVVHGMFGAGATQGVSTWVLAHDFTTGGRLEVAGPLCSKAALFVRLYAGIGLTLTTLQLDSLDDGHVYSQTTPALNTTAILEAGFRFWNTLEVFTGGGVIGTTPDAGLQFDLGSRLPRTVATDVTGVSRSGILLTSGVGAEF